MHHYGISVWFQLFCHFRIYIMPSILTNWADILLCVPSYPSSNEGFLQQVARGFLPPTTQAVSNFLPFWPHQCSCLFLRPGRLVCKAGGCSGVMATDAAWHHYMAREQGHIWQEPPTRNQWQSPGRDNSGTMDGAHLGQVVMLNWLSESMPLTAIVCYQILPCNMHSCPQVECIFIVNSMIVMFNS